MSLRNEWTFKYSAGDVADASATMEAWHASRKGFWEAERTLVITELRESGLEITEFEITGGQRHDVQFDPKLTKRLSEAQSKIGTHDRERERYAMFATVLGAHPDKPLDLHPDDVDYFGLARSTASVS